MGGLQQFQSSGALTGGHVGTARKRRYQWCVSLTPNNTKTIGRMTCHCFLRPIRRDLMSRSYTTFNWECISFVLGGAKRQMTFQTL